VKQLSRQALKWKELKRLQDCQTRLGVNGVSANENIHYNRFILNDLVALTGIEPVFAGLSCFL
jgi:hypothetical protein